MGGIIGGIYNVNIAKGQSNYIPNSGFEKLISLPRNQSDIGRLKFWSSPFSGFALKPNPTPNFLHIKWYNDVSLPNSYFGFVYPHGGKGIVGLMLYSEEKRDF